MYELKTNTAVRIAVGPLVDPTDGKTAETALTVTGMVVDILQMDNDGTAVNRTSFSPTASGGNNDMVHVTNDTVGMYDLELTAAQLNYLGNVRLVFYDVDGFLVHWIDLQLVSAAYFDWKYGTTLPNVNVTQISGDSTAADNCELMFDGTGYAGGTTKLDVNVATISNNAITANAINADAITNAKIADNAIAAENLAADCITSAKIADNAFANEHFANGALTSTEITSAGGCVVASIANNAITAAAIATGAIDADAIADNAIDAGAIATGAITNAKFAAGAIDATAIANGAIDAATFAADVDAEIATMIWNAATASYGGAGTYGQAVEDTLADTNELQGDWVNGGRLDLILDARASQASVDTIDDFLDTEIAAILADTNELQTDWHDGGRLDLLLDGASAPSAATVADAVWDEALAGHAGAGSAGAALTAAGSAGDPWSTALPGAYGAGTAGLLLGTTIPNAIDAIDNYVDTEVGALTTELAKVPKSDSNVSFNATAIAAIQNGLATPTNITAGTITTVTNLTNAPTNGDFTATMKSSITAAVPTAANNADAVWDEASTGHTDAGKAGAQLWTVLDDVPNTSEFQARTIAAADYTVVSDLGTVQTGDSFAIVNGDHGLVSIQDDIDAILADTPTAIAAVKTVVDLVEDILRNKMEITDANGNLVLYEDDGTTPKYSVNACVTDDATTTIRKRLE